MRWFLTIATQATTLWLGPNLLSNAWMLGDNIYKQGNSSGNSLQIINIEKCEG